MIGDARTKLQGPFLRAGDFRKLRDASAAALPIVRTPGVNTLRTSSGTVMNFKGTGTQWVFAFATTATHVICKLAIDTGTRFVVSQENSGWLKIRMAPNYTAAHFAKHIVMTPQPTLTDQCCRVEGGLIVPDYRMLPVDPAPPANLLPSCEIPLTESSEPCCDDCGQKAIEAEVMGVPNPGGCGCG